MIQGDLQCSVTCLHGHTEAVRKLTESWYRVPGLDLFVEGREQTLQDLEARHASLLEGMENFLPPTVRKITSHVHQAFQVS